MSKANNNRDYAVDARDVHKWYGAFHVLQGASLQVKRGEKIVICGPSGSGKSTFVRCLNGLETHQQGTILIHGTELGSDLRNLEKVRRMTGMVFQTFNLFPHMSVMDNCTLAPIWVNGMARGEAEEKALHYLKRVRIPEQADKYPEQLSSGQQQRVAIARALCMEPELMLFDEPTSALDPEMIKEVLDVMVDLAQAGMTMICITHEMGFARRAADRVVFIDKGQILADAPPEQFFSNPDNPRIKEFLDQILSH